MISYTVQAVDSGPVGSTAERSSHVWLLGIALLLTPTDAVLFGEGVTVYVAEFVMWLAVLWITAWEYGTSGRDVLASGLRRMPVQFAYVGWCAAIAVMAVAISGSGDLIGKVKNLLPGFMLGVVIVHVARSQAAVTRLVVLMLIGLSVNAGLGILQFSGGGFYPVESLENNVWKTDIFGSLLTDTANGFFLTPNNLGVALLTGSIISLASVWSLVRLRKNGQAIIWFLMSVLLLAGLYATQNKGCFLWLVVGVGLCLVRFRPHVPFALAVILVVIFLLGRYGLSNISDPGDTLVVRLQLWSAAQRVISEDPFILLLGDGMRQMPYWGSNIARWALNSSHNTWLDQILMYGLGGFALFCCMWIFALANASKAQDISDIWSRGLAIGLFASLAALAGENVFEPRADGPYQLAQVFVLFALARCQSRLAAQDAR